MSTDSEEIIKWLFDELNKRDEFRDLVQIEIFKRFLVDKDNNAIAEESLDSKRANQIKRWASESFEQNESEAYILCSYKESVVPKLAVELPILKITDWKITFDSMMITLELSRYYRKRLDQIEVRREIKIVREKDRSSEVLTKGKILTPETANLINENLENAQKENLEELLKIDFGNRNFETKPFSQLFKSLPEVVGSVAQAIRPMLSTNIERFSGQNYLWFAASQIARGFTRHQLLNVQY